MIIWGVQFINGLEVHGGVVHRGGEGWVCWGCHIRLCGSCGVDMLRFCDPVIVLTMFYVKG